MPAINFTVFQDKILSGEKCQTVRATARARPGDRLHLYTGMRTKACRKLGEAVCAAVIPVVILSGGPVRFPEGARSLRGGRRLHQLGGLRRVLRADVWPAV